ncbi:hypothetical protein SDJN03_24505, partial [Cucurbita argyrosperma subsp. sororia]
MKVLYHLFTLEMASGNQEYTSYPTQVNRITFKTTFVGFFSKADVGNTYLYNQAISFGSSFCLAKENR